MEVDNSKYIEYKMGAGQKGQRAKGRKQPVAKPKRGHTSRAEKQRVQERIERKRIMKETRRRQREDDEQETVPRRNHRHETTREDYSASRRRRR